MARGAFGSSKAEIIPFEPDAVNAVAGKLCPLAFYFYCRGYF